MKQILVADRPPRRPPVVHLGSSTYSVCAIVLGCGRCRFVVSIEGFTFAGIMWQLCAFFMFGVIFVREFGVYMYVFWKMGICFLVCNCGICT